MGDKGNNGMESTLSEVIIEALDPYTRYTTQTTQGYTRLQGA